MLSATSISPGSRWASTWWRSATLLAIAYVIFRPLAAPRALPAPAVRALAVDVVRAHGRDSLSFFKLRADKQYFFNEDRTAFVGYRIEAGVLLLSGDPVGPDGELAPLLAELRAFAHARGLKLGGIGASERMLPVYRELGLHTLYLGDEAIIETAAFSLEGRAIRKVRQSVHRLRKAGYTAECTNARLARSGDAREDRDGAGARSPRGSRARLLDGDGFDPR